MKFSARTRYAVRILFELEKAERPLPLYTLSEKTGIAFRTVENTHTKLKIHGVTEATIGSRGGIVLAKPLSEVNIGHLVIWFENGVNISLCEDLEKPLCAEREMPPTETFWLNVSNRIQKLLDGKSLEAILKEPRTFST